MESVLRHIRGQAAAHDLSTKILVVDDDELELTLMADRLAGVGLQVVTASNGVEALAVLDREWFPVVLTDWRMPVMDGMELIERLRSKGGEEVYIIMLSAQASAQDVERGYFNGVDDYLSKKSPDAELLARIESAFNTVMLRRSLKQVRSALATAVQANSEMVGSDGQRKTIMQLQAEMVRAQRYHRLLSLIMVRARMQSGDGEARRMPMDHALWRTVMETLGGGIRIQVDWLGQLDADEEDGEQLILVLPETGASAVPVVQHRLIVHLYRAVGESPRSDMLLQIDVSSVSLDDFTGQVPPDTLRLIAAARNNPANRFVLQPGVRADPPARASGSQSSDGSLDSDARRLANS